MSNLEKSNTINKLPLGLRQFAELRVGITPVKNMTINEKKRQCYDIITRAHLACGTKGNDSDILVFQTNELLSCLDDKYGELTIREVERAFEMLVAGEFGPFMGLFKKSYYMALKCYYELPQRNESLKQYLDIMNKETTPQLSPEEKAQKDKAAVLWYFEQYKKEGKLGTGYFTFYQTLWDLGHLRFSKEEKDSIYKKVSAEYKAGSERSMKRGQISKKQLTDILDNLDSNLTLKGELRKEALKRYFDSINELSL